MDSIISLVVSIAIILAIFVVAGVILWLVLGRKKKGEDKMVGTLEQRAILKGGSGTSGSFRNGVR